MPQCNELFCIVIVNERIYKRIHYMKLFIFSDRIGHGSKLIQMLHASCTIMSLL